MDIDVFDDDFEEVAISLEDQKYTHLEFIKAMDVIIYCMAWNAFFIDIFNSLDRLRWTAQQQRLKGKKEEPSTCSFF